MPLSNLSRQPRTSINEGQRVNKEVAGLQERLASVGYSEPPRKLNPLLWILRQLQRPESAIMNTARELTNSRGGATPGSFDPLQAFWRGLSLQEIAEGRDVASDLGFSREPLFKANIGPITFSPSPAGIAGLGLDIVNPLDPLNYVGFRGIKLPSKGGETAQALLEKAFGKDVAQEVFDHLTPEVAERLSGETVGELTEEVMQRAAKKGAQSGINLDWLGQRLAESSRNRGLWAGSRVMPEPRKALQAMLKMPITDRPIAKAVIPGSEQLMGGLSKLGSRLTHTQLGQAAGRMFSTTFTPDTMPGNVLTRMMRGSGRKAAEEAPELIQEAGKFARPGHVVEDLLTGAAPKIATELPEEVRSRVLNEILESNTLEEVIQKTAQHAPTFKIDPSRVTPPEAFAQMTPERFKDIMLKGAEMADAEAAQTGLEAGAKGWKERFLNGLRWDLTDKTARGENPLSLIPEVWYGAKNGLWSGQEGLDILTEFHNMYQLIGDIGGDIGKEITTGPAAGWRRLYQPEGGAQFSDSAALARQGGERLSYVDVPESAAQQAINPWDVPHSTTPAELVDPFKQKRTQALMGDNLAEADAADLQLKGEVEKWAEKTFPKRESETIQGVHRTMKGNWAQIQTQGFRGDIDPSLRHYPNPVGPEDALYLSEHVDQWKGGVGELPAYDVTTPVEVTLDKPFYIRTQADLEELVRQGGMTPPKATGSIGALAGDYSQLTVGTSPTGKTLWNRLRAKGYDGVIIRGTDENPFFQGLFGGDQVIVFDPTTVSILDPAQARKLYQLSPEWARQTKPYLEPGAKVITPESTVDEKTQALMDTLSGKKPETQLVQQRGAQAYQDITKGLKRMSAHSRIKEQAFMKDLETRIFKGLNNSSRKEVMRGALYPAVYAELPDNLKAATDAFKNWRQQVAQVYEGFGMGFTPLEMYVPFVVVGKPLSREESSMLRGVFKTGIKDINQGAMKAVAKELPEITASEFEKKSRAFLQDLLAPSMGTVEAADFVKGANLEGVRHQINDMLGDVLGGDATLVDTAGLMDLISQMDPYLKHRTTRAIDPSEVNKVLGREWLTEDAAVAMARRGIKAIRGQEAATFLTGMMQKYGLQINDLQTLGSLPPGYALVRPAQKGNGQIVLETIGKMEGKGLALPQEFTKAYNEYVDLLFNTEAKTAFGKFYDEATRVYKTMAYMWNPGHIPRDLGSNIYNLWLMDVRSPAPYAAAFQVLKEPTAELAFRNWRGTSEKLLKNLQELDLMDSGAVLAEFLQVGQDWTFKMGGKYTDIMRKATRGVDNYSRLVGALDRLSKGDTIELAVESTKKYLFDYFDLTIFEKRWMKRVVPFYTWMRKNIPLQVKTLMEKPGKLNTTRKWLNAFGGTPAQGETPEFIREEAGVRIPGEGGGLDVIPNLAYGDLAHLPFSLRTARTMLGGLNPLIRAPLEMLTNTALFSGQPLERYAGEQQNLPLAELLAKIGINLPTVPARTLGYLLDQIPPLRNASVLANPEHPRRGARALSLLGGPQMYPAAWAGEAAAYESRDDLRALIRYLQDKQLQVPTLDELRKRSTLNLITRRRMGGS